MKAEQKTYAWGALLALLVLALVGLAWKLASTATAAAPTFGSWLSEIIGESGDSFGTAWDNWGSWFGGAATNAAASAANRARS